MTSKNVLLIGLHQSAVDFSKWPGLSPESLVDAFGEVKARLEDAGFEPTWCLIRDVSRASDEVVAAIGQSPPDIISIGAGVRADPDHLLLFEELVNTCHAHAPNAKFAFNKDPPSTVEAVLRWA
ncbi:MAG: hypothetical protein AAGD00_00985 [Planctomycetota bacterium]